MSFGTLYTYSPNARILKVIPSYCIVHYLLSRQIQAAAALNGLSLDIAPDFQLGTSNRTPEFLTKFPLGKVPAFESADGKVFLSESDAIAQFVAESGPRADQLLGANAVDRAVIRQWISFADHEIMDPIVQLILWRVGLGSFEEAVEEKALGSLRRGLQCLESHLAARQGEWVANSAGLSLADLTLASSLYWGFMLVIDASMREEFSAVDAWYRRAIVQDGVSGVFGGATFIEKRQQRP